MTSPQVLSKIVLWGDSLTQTGWEGWVAGLANRYQRRADIVNRGMSGYNSSWFLLLPEEDFSKDQVCLMTIWFGANDASLEEHNPHHYVSLEDYQKNLRTLVTKARTNVKCPRVLLITPPPVDHDQRLEFQKIRYPDSPSGILERTLENSGKYAEACKRVAQEENVPCLDLWTAFQTDKQWSRFLSDGLHFSKEGHDFVVEQLLQIIEQKFPDIAVTPDKYTGQSANSGSKCPGLVQFGPYHDQIDYPSPQTAMDEAFGVDEGAKKRKLDG